MRIRTGFSIGGAIVTAGFSAVGLAFNAFNVFPNIEWKWIALISFIVFVIIVWQGWLASEHRAKRFENGKPNLEWVENHQYPLYAKEANGTIKVGDYLCFASQIWFKNKPILSTDDSIAKDVIATVTFYDKITKTVMSIPACFIISEARDHAGNTGELIEKVEKWSPAEIWKLQIAIKRKEKDDAFGFAKGDITSRVIKRGSYYVSVLLEGTRVIDFKLLWFNMENPGIDGDLAISDKPVKKPNLRKEGFQI